MAARKPRTKAPKEEQMKESLTGSLARYASDGLYQHAVNDNTAYRYKGALLAYQSSLNGKEPNLVRSKAFLANLRKEGYSPSTIRIHRAVLKGFHADRGEILEFAVSVPRRKPIYVEPDTVDTMLGLAKPNPFDYLVLRLMTDAGLRRGEEVNLKVGNVGRKALRFRGKGSKDRTVPLTEELSTALVPFCEGKSPDDSVLGVGQGVIYCVVKKYGAMVGKPEIKPHDLRHYFATRLVENNVNIRSVQELLGHTNLNTTQDYVGITAAHLEEAIKTLNKRSKEPEPRVFVHCKDTPHRREIRQLVRTFANNMHFPSVMDKNLWKVLPLEFQPGKYFLPIGLVEIDKHGLIKVQYHEITSGIGEPHLFKGLISHLDTSGLPRFKELVGDRGKIANFQLATSQYSEKLLLFLKLISDSVVGSGTKVWFHEEQEPGLRSEFIITTWIDAVQRAGNHHWMDKSWYKPLEPVPDKKLLQLRCGPNIIAIEEHVNQLTTYQRWHEDIRAEYTENPLAKEIAIKDNEITELLQEIKQRLLEFGDLESLPGNCDLCR